MGPASGSDHGGDSDVTGSEWIPGRLGEFGSRRNREAEVMHRDGALRAPPHAPQSSHVVPLVFIP